MEFSVDIGWWAVPVFVTILAFTVAGLKFVPSGDYGAGGILNVGFLMIASIVSLIAWLIYALAT
jgi:hypothetical protein